MESCKGGNGSQAQGRESRMQYWKAHYMDALHDTDIEILNTEEEDFDGRQETYL